MPPGRLVFLPALKSLLAMASFAAMPSLGAEPAPMSGRPDYDRMSVPGKAATAAMVERLRSGGWAVAGPSYLEFGLRELRHRGPERERAGRLWAGRNEAGPATRIVLTDGGVEIRLLVQGGIHPRVWRWDSAFPVHPVDLFAPLAPGFTITPFDLQMPFLFWPDPRTLSVNRILGRQTNGLVFQPPPDFSAAHPEVQAVRAYLDAIYAAPVEIQLLGRDGAVRRTLSLVGLKKVSNHWIPEDLDVRDETTRDKTRFSVQAASFRRDLAPALFEPEHLGEPFEPPGDLVRVR